MDAQSFISDLSRRYGIPTSFASSMKPLIERALNADPAKRERLLAMVERSFAQEAEIRKQSHKLPQGDWRVLTTVASILHSWDPPRWLKSWGTSGGADSEATG